MFFVVPAEEVHCEGASILDRAEARREAWPVLQGAELALGVRVVIGDVRAAVGLGDAKVAEQEGNGL